MKQSESSRTHGRPSMAAILVVPLIAAVVLTLFAWPSGRLQPRDLPIGVAGPPSAAAPIENQLAAEGDSFNVHRYADENEARTAIEDREIYGAFVATDRGQRVLIATAASPAVAQLLDHAATEAAAAAGTPPVVDDVVSAPRGAALGSSVLPLLIAGIVTGVLASLIAQRGAQRAWLVGAGAILAGLVATGIVQSWLGIVEGNWAENAAALSLTVLAIASVVAGAHALFGERGVIVAALSMVLIGNPFSGIGSAPELLPEPAGAFGQLMPPGAGGNLLRSTGYFDGAGAGDYVLVLTAWAVGGLILIAAGSRRTRRSLAEPAPPRPRDDALQA
jgi:hypothetical protein